MSKFIRKKPVNISKKTKINGKNGNGKLPPNEKIFADEWLIDRNGTRAYKAAYPNVKNDQSAAVFASQMLRKHNVSIYIGKRLDKLAAKAEMNQEWILAQHRKLIECRIDNFFDDEGNPKKMSEISKDQLFAVSGMKIGKATEFKLHNKQNSLDSIGRYLGMFEKDNLQKTPRQINVKLVD